VRRLALAAALAGGLLLLVPGPAAAHPLGNFTVNQYNGLRLQPDRVLVDYVVDMAEIPAFQARQEIDTDGDGTVAPAEAAAWREATCPRLAAGLGLRLDGRRLALTTSASRLSFPPGAGGLVTLRLECDLSARAGPAAGRRTLAFSDRNWGDRIGWREITARGQGTTLLASDVPATSASARLTSYPSDLLRSPLDQRSATLSFRLGGGRGGAPVPLGGGVGTAVPMGVDRATRAFTELVARQRLGVGFGLLAVGLALLLGAVHALAPGHGKTVMAAYLLGMRGSLRQSSLVALTVTVTHTAGVLLLGVALSASTALAPERIYPWLGLASGLLLAGVGATLLRRALRAGLPAMAAPGAGHDHPHYHPHDHPHERGQAHAGDAARQPGWRSLVSVGFAGGLVPSPSALVVLLGAIALGRAWYGVLLVLAYGAGMAATLTGAGMVLVRARVAIDRRSDAARTAEPVPGSRLAGRARQWLASLSRSLPAATAGVLVLGGLYLAARGVAGI
jgi:nickel/cobalt transporter (NicO) family protein